LLAHVRNRHQKGIRQRRCSFLITPLERTPGQLMGSGLRQTLCRKLERCKKAKSLALDEALAG
jgi:hypothetical protein